MSLKFNMQLMGDKELQRKLAQLGDCVAGKALADSAMAGAQPIRNAAEEKAPKRTRTLARSIHAEVVESSRERALVDVGTDLEYAAIHEFGGVIKPKNVKNLAIPLTKEARAAGSPRNMDDLKFIQMPGGTKLLVDDFTGEAQYVLKESVTVPARPYLRPALDEQKDAAVEETGHAFRVLVEAASR